MKISKTMLNGTLFSVMFSVILSSSAIASTDDNRGTLTFTGEIVASPCSIYGDDVKQTINMGHVSSASLRNNSAPVKTISIRLVGCDLQKYKPDGSKDKGKMWSFVKAKFSGTTINNHQLLKINNNVGIELRQGGKAITFGTDSDKMELTGDQTLPFQAQVKAINPLGDLVPTAFNSVANFELSYE
ncbi:fimbrial protein [Escherichia coli]|uniref:fimbrial protein n=1 Tax=Escherichia coli TaxID=562 RepID=UPI00215700C9|nr:fimbrial protein [Escherichia coli]